MKPIIILSIISIAFFTACIKSNAPIKDTFLYKKLPDLIREKGDNYKCKYKNKTPISAEDIKKLLTEVPSFAEKFQTDIQNSDYDLSQIEEICYSYPAIYAKFRNEENGLSIAEWREEYGMEFFKNANGNILYFNDVKNILLPKAINKNTAQRGDMLVYSADSLSAPDTWQFFLIEKLTLTGFEIENCSREKGCTKEYKEGDKVPVNKKLEYTECNLIENVEKRDACILEIARSDYYYSEKIKYPPEEICGQIEEKNPARFECFWNYAMKTKDQSLCGFLAANEIKDADSYYENHTKSNCQNELHYTYGDADWRLGQYKPDEPYYMGSATIEGWMIFTTSYVSGLSAHFHVSPNSIEKLPPSLQNQEDFLVQYRDKDGRWQRLEDESEMPSLFKYSEKNPGKIKITGILRQMEGSPYISLESVINESAFDQCVTSENAQSQDSCLFDLAQNDFYDLEELKYLPEEVCGKILENSTERAQCFWGYAMRLKNEELCKFLPQEIKEIAETMKGYSYPVDYTTQNECKKAIQYTYQGAEWKLTYGIPPYADPFTLIYEGSAEISGWMSYEMVYDEKMLMFHVEDTSIKKLPLVAQQRSEYFLKYKDANGEVQTVKEENQIPELFKYDTTNPATIKVTKIIMRMEGSPSIILEKIIE